MAHDKLHLLPGVGYLHDGERWQPALIDRAAHLTGLYEDVITIGEARCAVFNDARGRRWAKQLSVVEGEQGATWSAEAFPSDR